jgi:AAA domain
MREIEPMGRGDQFLIDGLLSSSMSILAGEPKAGKSLMTVGMAAALVERAPTYLGLPVTRHLDRVAFGLTDPEGMRETRGRIGPMLTDLDRVMATTIRDDGGARYWERLTDNLDANGVELFILDNVLGAIPPDADISQGTTARRLLDGVDHIMRAGIAVLLVTHTAKPGQEGSYSNGGTSSPIGGRLFGARPRTILSLTRSRKHGLALRVDSNHAEQVAMPLTLTVKRNGAPIFEVRESKGQGRVTAKPAAPRDWREALADQIVAEQPASSSLRAVAEQYAAKVGKSAHTLRLALGDFLTHDGTGWRRPLRVVG